MGGKQNNTQMNETFDKLCKKHNFSSEAKVELKKFLESELVRALDIKGLIDQERETLVEKGV